MAFRRIAVSNFKSFRQIDVEFGRFNVVIGPNASGKSNFVQVFRFLRDIVQFGLTNAISLQGGIEYLTNLRVGPKEDLELHLTSDSKFGLLTRRVGDVWQGVEVLSTEYGFALRFDREGTGFEVVQEKLTERCRVVRSADAGAGKLEEADTLGQGRITVTRDTRRIDVLLDFPPEAQLGLNDLMPAFVIDQELDRQTLFAENPFLFPPPLKQAYSEISVYDFDPKLPKKATPVTGKAELEEDGSNLSLILKSILANTEKRRKFLNLVGDVLPFVEDVDVVKFADKSLIFKIREEYCQEGELPASLISDGTINVIALVAALYFENKAFAIIEEPERNIHPRLISRVVNMMEDASRGKQVLATTHNPELIRHVNIEDLLFVTRDAEGFSIVSRPSRSEHVQAFLENDIGVDDLFVQGVLDTL